MLQDWLAKIGLELKPTARRHCPVQHRQLLWTNPYARCYLCLLFVTSKQAETWST